MFHHTKPTSLSLLLICLTCVSGGFTTMKIGPKPLWNATFTDKLRQDLLLNYDKFARPTPHVNATTVRFGITIRHFDLNEVKSSLTVHAWFKMMWDDGKLKWNASDYGDLDVLHLADHEIWQPDLFIYNGATSTAINHYGNTHAMVHSNGNILLVPPGQLTVICEINLRYWPFDTQQCSLKIGSWTYHGEQINLQLYDTPVEADLLTRSNEWNLKETSIERNEKYYSCCVQSYPDITVYLTIERVSPSYKAIIITPAFAIIFLTLIIFWLPPQAGEKLILQGFTTVIISIFLLYFTQKLPAMGDHTPLIVLFYSNSLYVICFSMIGSVSVIWISRTRHAYGLPWILKQLFTGWIGRWLLLGPYISQTSLNTHRVTAEEMRDHQVTDLEENNTNDDHQMIGNCLKTPIQQDWILFAAAIDRLSFIFYSLLFVVLAIAYAL